MTKVSVTKQIGAPAIKAWENLSSFRGIEHISPIERSVTDGHGEGATRTCFMPDGAAIHEVLSRVDQQGMEMEYKITEGPFPVEGYVSTIHVKPVGEDNCEITWNCQFESAPEAEQDMSNLFGGFYNVIIDSLEKHLQPAG